MLRAVTEPRAPRRGRPPNQDRRRAIVRAALALIPRYGFRGTPMRAIADAVGISEPLLFRYYRTKRELLDAVSAYVLEAYARLITDAAADAARPTTLREFLTSVGRRLMLFNHDVGAWYAVQATSPIPPDVRRHVAATREQAFQVLASGMAARGDFADSYLAARTFTGAIVYDDVVRRNANEPPPSAALRAVFIEQLVDLIAAGREAVPPRSLESV